MGRRSFFRAGLTRCCADRGYRFHECDAAPIAEPPPPLPELAADEWDAWHRAVAAEAVEAYNFAVRENKRRMRCPDPRASSADEQRDVLVMHEMHRGRFGGKLNHRVRVGSLQSNEQ